MRLIRRFIPLLLLAGLVTSDETEPAKKEAKEAAETFKVELTPQKPDAKVRIGYSAAKTVDVETTVPRFL